ncbi:MAG TPA: sortase [Candidatus Saccharimonadales bacterium]|nr:sortase [Candidatus Saccharimonadales bacterium]
MLQQNNSDDQKDDGSNNSAGDASYTLNRSGKRIEPPKKRVRVEDPATNMIRQKIADLYDDAPEASDEMKEVRREEKQDKPLSKHQKFMYELSTSGKGLAEIQTAWHNYYVGLPDDEKHAVWREFYENSGQPSQYQKYIAQQPEKPKAVEAIKRAEEQPQVRRAVNPNQSVIREYPLPSRSRSRDRRTAVDIKRQLVGKVSADGKLKAKHHAQSLLFGLGIGTLVVLFTMFSFFNDRIIAPFIQPSRTASATPLILGADNISPNSTPEVIIPKINVEIPLVGFDIQTTDENQIENSLEDGVVHYPTTVNPGQKGNAAFFGHSSNNIFNPGKYKFAFALLHDIVPGDTFYLTYNGKVYAYQVYEKKVVDPSEVGVLDNVPGKVATATLITCDPPGTSLHRLVVWGEQVSPNPSGNVGGTNTSATATQATQLPDNGPTLWNRLTSWL